MLEIFGIKFFTIALCIFTIERMHALIHMCHVLHKAFSKIPTILLEDVEIFNEGQLPLIQKELQETYSLTKAYDLDT